MIRKTDLSISIYENIPGEEGRTISFRATPGGVYVRGLDSGFVPKFVIFLKPDDADALETWLREERELREAGGPGAGGVKS